MYKLPFVFETMQELVIESCRKYKDNIAARYLTDKIEVKKSFSELYSDIKSCSEIIGKYAGHKDIVLMACSVSYYWLVLYFAIVSSGIIAVPINTDINKEEYLETFKKVKIACAIFDKTGIGIINNIGNDLYIDNILELDVLEQRLIEVDCKKKRNTGFNDVRKVYPDDCAMIMFTSGTTNKPKAVMMTHRNISENMKSIRRLIKFTSRDSILPILPIYHSFGMFTQIQMPLYVGAAICIGSGKLNLAYKEMQYFKPTVITLVPQILKGIYKKIISMPGLNQKKVKSIEKVYYIMPKQTNRIRRALFQKVIDAFGGRLRIIICGGANFPVKIGKFFISMGISCLNGYGATECCPLISVNTVKHIKPSSVGIINPSLQIRIEDGQILLKGPSIFPGYFNDDRATQNCFTSGWYKTGDIGYKKKRQLYVLGRKNNTIILSNGEKICPESIESLLEAYPFIDHVHIFKKSVEDEIEFITAEIFIHPESLISSSINDSVMQAVSKVNSLLPPYKRVRNPQIIFSSPIEKTLMPKHADGKGDKENEKDNKGNDCSKDWKKIGGSCREHSIS